MRSDGGRRPARPPRCARWLLERLLPAELRDAFLGDLEEQHARATARQGRAAATLAYWLQVLRCRPIALRRALRAGASLPRNRSRPMNGILEDIAQGFRRLKTSRAQSALAVLTLAFGVGVSTAIFSVVDGVLLRPLPYAAPDALVRINVGRNSPGWIANSEPEFLDVRKLDDVFTGVAAFNYAALVLGDSLAPRRIRVVQASAALFSVLGESPLLGRTFTEDEDRRGQGLVVVISWDFWQQQFGGRPDVIGQTIRLSDQAAPIIGVMPRGFAFPDPEVQAWVPVRIDVANPWARNNHYLEVIARVRPGLSVSGARARLDALAAASQDAYPEFYSDGGYRMRTLTLREHMTGDVQRPLFVVLGAVGLVLAIACVNIASLLLARGEARRRELAVRAALGARSGRLARLTLIESAWIALLGGGLGASLAAFTVGPLLRLAPASLPRVHEVSVNGSVLLFSLLVVVVTGVAFSVWPARSASRADPADAMKEGGTGRIGGRHRQAARRTLVVVQLALAVALVLGAGVLVRSMIKLYGVDAGIDPANVLTLRLTPTQARYPGYPEVIAYYESALERVRAIPGVISAGAVSSLPLASGLNGWSFQIEGKIPASIGDAPAADINMITPDYFRAMNQELVRGRAFTSRDRAGTLPVVIISESMASQYFPGQDPIGKRFRVWEPWPWMEIVGVVRDVHYYGVDREARPTWYVPHAQAYESAYTTFYALTMVVRTAGEPSGLADEVRAVLRSIDSSIPIENVLPMERVLDASLGTRRFTMVLIAGFAVLALFLAAVGVYGVVAGSVAARGREIGVRMALGARRPQVLLAVLIEALALAGLGIIGGLLIGLASSAAMTGLVFGVPPMDPVTVIVVAAGLLLTTALAALSPALRATRVDPLAALRVE
jgi:putative ABC transport system permease protein